MQDILEHFVSGFRNKVQHTTSGDRRIGAELKFPIVETDGGPASREAVEALWAFLGEQGWQTVTDKVTNKVVGATNPGPMNDTLASCETGYCKPEFAMAHVGDLEELSTAIEKLRECLRAFSEREGVCFLGYGIQPKVSPGKHLLLKQARTAFWGDVLHSNNAIPPEEGDDVHLFTVNASSQVHVDVSEQEAIDAINVFCGLSGAQIALTANSSVWRNRVDPEFKCVCEMFWDWWQPTGNRTGVPDHPFKDITDYVDTIAKLTPVYVKRDGKPIGIMQYDSFEEYYKGTQRVGVDTDGQEVSLTPCKEDIDQHGTFYWYNARISRYNTLENRVNDQQPPGDMVSVAALTLGLLEDLPGARAILKSYSWEDLRSARAAACRDALEASTDKNVALAEIAERMLKAAQSGLEKRGRGEERFLEPMWQRLRERRSPADEAIRLFKQGGAEAIVKERRL